ncbi:MAG: site-2 protease family protein [Legionellales bacterium]|nr:site-2 protease family protein [Legionellales bacterium]
MLILTLIQKVAVWILPMLLAITLHEAAHAFVASRCGDSTARALGRLSINPIRHIDPIGTLVVPLLIGVLSQFQFIFGWAKPVPIDWHNLRKPRRDMALVAAAGPLSNVIMALIWGACFKCATLLHPETSSLSLFVLLTAQAGILINLVLAILNLIPLPPLDGSRIISAMLSPKQAQHYQKIERFGFLILMVLLLTGVLSWFLEFPLTWALGGIKYLYQI